MALLGGGEGMVGEGLEEVREGEERAEEALPLLVAHLLTAEEPQGGAEVSGKGVGEEVELFLGAEMQDSGGVRN